MAQSGAAALKLARPVAPGAGHFLWRIAIPVPPMDYG